MTTTARDKLIVALDVDTKAKALALVDRLLEVTGTFKIGSQLFTAAGPDIVRHVIAKGAKIFLDLKFHDIPATVAAAGEEATRLGVSIFNIHGTGGGEMMKRTADAVSECAEREGLSRPKVIAVTVLTSSDAIELDQVGIERSPADQAVLLARLAIAHGMDGVVASPQEISLVRSISGAADFIIVTPGVRPAGSQKHDQKRVMSPAEAIARGADYLVVGRPILSATDPVSVAENIVREISDGIKASSGSLQ
jgi:orotidine-5'-phosphate decarboxylase